jgi:hypothetical protein
MSKKLYWGLGVLVLLICTAFIFMTIRNRAEVRQLKRDLYFFQHADQLQRPTQLQRPNRLKDPNQVKGLEKHLTQQPASDNKPPREARDGYKWEWHTDHWSEMPIAQSDLVYKDGIPMHFIPPKSDGTSIAARAAASDEVPRYADLKQMTDEELGKLMEESYRKSEVFDDEWSRRLRILRETETELTKNAKTNAEYHRILDENQDKLKPLEAAEMDALWQSAVHSETGDKAFDVIMWRAGLERSKHPERQISWVLPEPFDE